MESDSRRVMALMITTSPQPGKYEVLCMFRFFMGARARVRLWDVSNFRKAKSDDVIGVGMANK